MVLKIHSRLEVILMAVKVRRFSTDPLVETNPVFTADTSFDQRETTVDGYTFHWGANQTRNFADDSVGERHAAFGAVGVAQDIKSNNTSHS